MEKPDEVGRELEIADLVPETVVVVEVTYRDLFITMWVLAIDETTVTFYSGEMNWHVINFIKDGQILDDQGRRIKVYEYLGKV